MAAGFGLWTGVGGQLLVCTLIHTTRIQSTLPAHGGFIILLSALASGSRIQRGLFTIAHRFLGCVPY